MIRGAGQKMDQQENSSDLTQVEQVAELYLRYQADIKWHIFYRLDDMNLAEDFTQITFLRFWRSVKGGKKIRFPRHYLIKIADNVVNHYLNEGKKTEIPITSFSYDKAASDQIVEREANDPGVEAYILMREAISELDCTTQQVIIYREFEGRTYEEISKITGLSRKQIDYLTKKGAIKIKEHLS